MARMKGLDVRALLRLGCLVFFLVILRNKFSTGNDRRASIKTDNLSVSEFGRVEQGLSRHLLGLDEQLRSREWKQRAGKIAAIVEQGNLNASFPDLRRGAVEGSMQHSMPVDLDKLPNPNLNVSEGFTACDNVKSHIGFPDSCSYVRANSECQSGTMIEYTVFFYCTCAKSPTLGYMFLIVWLAALFYMLGNTAADFFCSALEKLSKLLHLPPTVAGVSLLPLGNGAPDVFASIAAFMGSSHGQVSSNVIFIF